MYVLFGVLLLLNISELPHFRKIPEIKKFQIEIKNFRENETLSVDKK